MGGLIHAFHWTVDYIMNGITLPQLILILDRQPRLPDSKSGKQKNKEGMKKVPLEADAAAGVLNEVGGIFE